MDRHRSGKPEENSRNPYIPSRKYIHKVYPHPTDYMNIAVIRGCVLFLRDEPWMRIFPGSCSYFYILLIIEMHQEKGWIRDTTQEKRTH